MTGQCKGFLNPTKYFVIYLFDYTRSLGTEKVRGIKFDIRLSRASVLLGVISVANMVIFAFVLTFGGLLDFRLDRFAF